jgi:hypothetical protein
MPTISIYRGNQRCEDHAALGGDLSQTVPVLVFKADAGLVVCNSNRTLRRALRNLNVRTSLPQMSHRGMLLDLGGCLEGRPEWAWAAVGNTPVSPCSLRARHLVVRDRRLSALRHVHL